MVMAIACLATFLAPAPPDRQDLQARLVPPAWAGGSPRHLLGTDHLGRDVLSRLLHGARATLLVAGTTVTLAGAAGTALGLLAGYYGGRVDAVLGRVMDVQLAIPYMLLAIVIVMLLGPGVVNTIIVLVVGGWVIYARLVRAEVLSLRAREFVLAARALGTPDVRILLRHVLPNTVSSLVIVATIELGNIMLFESSLSFLGLGVRPPLVSWGSMLSDGRDYLTVAWWVAVFPGLAIALTVFGVNQLGDWLRDLLDPRLRVA
ncbi:MAG: ABC transporter permease [Armatimonadota bacterium]|nr:ABC transporter permease [Armatimonadota bacterium]MDR7488522.1 ABC transporter permease [Armatimonadota bacterium]MDR7573787.1 ABC transporter permease [Armatimonadota bacterium]MDR7586534.1 ABC transporter permease [Armatimonadota bacterium]